MGHILEVYRYEKTMEKKDNNETEEAKKKKDEANEKWKTIEGIVNYFPEDWDNGNINGILGWDRKIEYVKTVAHRRRESVRRLANMNFGNNDCFVTLTYRENITSVKDANADFKDFIKRLKRLKYSTTIKDKKGKTRYITKTELKYLAVVEFQKRGAVHYHILINLKGFKLGSKRQIEESQCELAGIWKNGVKVDIQPLRKGTIDNVGAYMIKYLEKGFMDERTRNNNMYLSSRNLIKPKVIRGDDAETIANSLIGSIPVYTNEYDSFYCGNVQYKEYNLMRMGLNI